MRKIKSISVLEPRRGDTCGRFLAVAEDGTLWYGRVERRWTHEEEGDDQFLGYMAEWHGIEGPPDGDPGTAKGMTIEEQVERLRKRGSGSVGSLTRRK